MFFQFENWKQRQISGNGVFVQAGVRKVHVDVLMKEKTANHLLHSPLEMLICPQPSQMTMSDLKTDCQTTLLPLELTFSEHLLPSKVPTLKKTTYCHINCV